MKKTVRKTIIRLLTFTTSFFLLYIGALLIYGTLNDYQPEAVVPLAEAQKSPSLVINDSVLSFLTWNIGYGGLGAEADFFFEDEGMLYSGASMVRPPRELTEKYTAGITNFIQNTVSDFFLLQEIDVDSKRSYHINQFDTIWSRLPGYSAFFAPNYNLPSVIVPLLEPWNFYGKVYSGVATFSKYQPAESIRYQLPGSFAWPTRILQLDRCILLQRYVVKNGKQLVLLNVHNSAYDKDGSLKRQERAFIRELMLKEYEQGNYVIAGGDWNECPPNFAFNTFKPNGDTQGYEPRNVPEDFLPENWLWVYDPTVPTNRSVKDAYQAGVTFTTLIDYFLVSPNVQVLKIKGLNLDFIFSDHQPVWIEVLLK